ncbi:MAG: hypothetical protein COW30_18140, partial [Rhodospirillales bacterium CG15_BIG_FIL_POST_REV_8_21_14_020_66_15]
GGPGDGDRQLQVQAADYAPSQQVSADELYTRLVQRLGSTARDSNMSLDEAKQALANLEGISRLLHEYTGAALPSD